jgi:replicative DNA helicase
MAVAELPPRGARSEGRVPPHNLDAEESLLGAMLLSRDAIVAATEVGLTADEFYKPGHGHVFEAITSLYGAGEPSDPVTVAEELRRAGLLEAIGGPAVLVSLQASTPATSNAARYARIISELSLLRRLIGVASEIAEIGYSVPDDVLAAVDRAESMVFDVAQRRVTDSMSPIKELLDASLTRLEMLYEKGDSITGLPTGYHGLDELMSGLQPSTLVIVGARPATGKCLTGDTPMVDPRTGARTTLAELYERGSGGGEVAVTTIGDDQQLHVRRPSAFVDDGIKPVYRVRTRLGREVRTTAAHPFLTPEGWRPLADIAVGAKVAVPNELPVFGDRELPEHEVALLAHLLGDEAASLASTKVNPAVLAEVDALASSVADQRGVLGLLRRHGMLGRRAHEKRVPDAIFTLPRHQLALFLNRLFAGGGSIELRPGGAVVLGWSAVSEPLVRDVQHLLLRFGCNARLRRRTAGDLDTRLPAFELEVTERSEVQRFLHEVGIYAREGELAGALGVAAVPVRRGGGAPVAVLDEPDLTVAGPSAIHWDEVVAIESEGTAQVYDLTVPGEHNFVAADVFVHNTAFALGMATHAALEVNRPVLFFSLEMSHLEITQRILSAEARVDATRMRNGKLAEADWTKLSHAIGRLAEAPLYIDDNPQATVMEIRAKARRLKSQVGDLGVIIIDYLQLMTGRTSAENRQVEVSEISRGLKILARELEVPVVALSQLSRQLELRADKRPMLADLRESGCLTAGTRLLRADTNAEVTLGELLTSDARDVPVWSLDERWRLVPSTLTHAFPSGVKPVFRMRLASGRTIEATANHKFRTLDDWVPLGELSVGSRLAVPRRLDGPEVVEPMAEHEVVLLAHLLGDGCVLPRQPVHYTSADPANLDAVESAAAAFGITPRRVAQGNWWHTYLPAPFPLTHGTRNPISAWWDELGLHDCRSWQKFVPDRVFRLPRDQVALFLRHLWATDGSLTIGAGKGGRAVVRCYYASTSRRLVDGVRQLLLRFGIQTRVTIVPEGKGREGYQLRVDGVEHQRRFLTEIGVHGRRGEVADAALELLADIVANPNVDTIPFEVRDRIVDAMADAGMSHRQLAAALGEEYSGSYLLGSPSRPRTSRRDRLERMADVLGSKELHELATSDVLWDTVVAIEPLGEQAVYDATVLGTHNFIADGIVAHNSLEQDADVVMFLYRDELYNPESPDRGTSEVLVAKHRAGPTGMDRLAFLDHYTRFANMARNV